MKRNLAPHLDKIWKLFAWSTLILAFIIGNIASEPDYLLLAKAHYPNYDWSRSEIYPDSPVVFVPAPGVTDQALVVATGKGFGGPFVLGVRVQKEQEIARVKEVVVLSHKETPPYLQKLIKQNFFRQFMNTRVSRDYLFDEDIDGISGATISSKGFTKGIRDALHKGAQSHLDYEKTWREVEWSPGINEALMVALFLMVLVVVYAPRKIAKPFKIALPFASLAFVGFYVNASISLGTLAGIVMGYVPEFTQHPIWWIIIGGVFAGIILLGRNLYCGYLCPFSVVQDLLQKISGIKLALRPGMAQNARRVIYGLSWLALVLIFLSRHPALGSYEPFSMMFSLKGMGIQWYILPFSLLGSFLVPQFWCRLFCPVGLYLSEAVRLRQATVQKVGSIFIKDITSESSASESYSQANEVLTIVFGTQTGNSKRLAYQMKASMDANGLPVRVKSIADYQIEDLKQESYLIVVTSTYGEGDPPEDVVRFHKQLFAEDAPKLNNLKYAVLALGDSSYRFFCKTGVEFDQRLADLGAQSFIERIDCDVDYDEQAETWIMSVVKILQYQLEASCANVVNTMEFNDGEQAYYNKNRPFSAKLIRNDRLTADNCEKDFRHIVLSLQGSGIQYKPGDLLSVYFENCAEEIDSLLESLAISANVTIELKGKTTTIRQALIESFELSQCHPGFIEKYAQLSQQQELLDLLDDADSIHDYAAGHQTFEVVRRYPCALTAEQFLPCLRKLTPRKYSISSSQAEVEDEVHLTVTLVDYHADGHHYFGGATGFLCKRLALKGEVKVFVEDNENFRLPKHSDAPIIMIGPGTGIAPFRAFLQERAAKSQQGKNWLFFGNQNQPLDYLYKEEWLNYLEQGVLDSMDLAFSRDQEEKIYVQHRILEQAGKFYDWLEQGAYIYICGDVSNMAVDVEKTILQVIEQQGNMSGDDALQYLTGMKQNKRFLKDVY